MPWLLVYRIALQLLRYPQDFYAFASLRPSRLAGRREILWTQTQSAQMNADKKLKSAFICVREIGCGAKRAALGCTLQFFLQSRGKFFFHLFRLGPHDSVAEHGWIWSRKSALSGVFSWTISSGRRRTGIQVDDLPNLGEDYWTALEILADETGNIRECMAQKLPWFTTDADRFEWAMRTYTW